MSRRKSNKKYKKKIEASKLILAYILALTTIVAIFSMVIVAITKDTTPLVYLIPAVFAELATGTGFYYSKAKAENELKIGKTMDKIQQKTPEYPDIDPYKEVE